MIKQINFKNIVDGTILHLGDSVYDYNMHLKDIGFYPVAVFRADNSVNLEIYNNERIWCAKNCKFGYKITSLHFIFENIDDAMRFKLTWC